MPTSVTKELAFAIGFYATCSGSMLFLNKLIFSLTADRPAHLRLLPGPISALQLLFAVCFCSALQLSGVLTFQKVTVQQVKMYAVYAVLFVGSVYASMKSLEGSNVETQIVFRSATPLTVCVLDALWLGRELPHTKALAALAAVAAGAVIYVATDAAFELNGFSAYGWVFLYYLLICAEMTLGKHLTSACKVDHVWTSVLLTNGLSLPLLALLSWARGEFATLPGAVAATSPYEWSVVLAGCATGTLIGWSGWHCRGLVSATSYTLIGVANKMLTVLLAVAFLDKHASGTGIAALLLCIGASTQYEQAPLAKKAADQSDPKLLEKDDDDATAALLARRSDPAAPPRPPPS